jgi:hypothetical protein
MMQDFTFEMWMTCLREDCRRKHKLLVSDTDGLQMLWIYGVEPTVQAIIEQANSISHLDLSSLMFDSMSRN